MNKDGFLKLMHGDPLRCAVICSLMRKKKLSLISPVIALSYQLFTAYSNPIE